MAQPNEPDRDQGGQKQNEQQAGQKQTDRKQNGRNKDQDQNKSPQKRQFLVCDPSCFVSLKRG